MKKKPVETPVPKMGEVIRPKQDRNDGWHNLVTLLGTSADKRTHNHLTWDFHQPEFYEQVYAGGGIPARIVDVVPEHAMRNWVDWVNLNKKTKKEREYAREAIEERCLEVDLRGNFLKSWKWGRAYGGGLLHIVTDTQDPSSPLTKGEQVLALRDLSRWDVRILTTDVEYDFGSPNYGHPRIYYLNVQMGSQYKGYPIHWTRMVRFDGQLVPRRTFIRNNYWHDSILNRIYNSIRNYEGSNDAVAAMLHDFNVDVYKLKNVAQMIGAGKEQKVKDRIEMMNFTKSVINAMILDADTEDYESKAKSVEGIAELLRLQADRLVADTEIPHTILLGESPDGSNATGNSTSQQWNNFLKAEQEHVAKPKLNRVIDILFQDIEELRPKFRPLRVLDELEMADVKLKTAQTDDIYLTQQVLDPTEVAESRFGGDEYSTETQLDEEARESGEIAPGSNTDLPDDDDGEDGSSNEDEKTEVPQKKGKPEKDQGPGPKGVKKRKDSATAPQDIAEPEDMGIDAGQSEFEPRNAVVQMGNAVVPKTKPIISQTESLPMRDPKTDPHLKGPGIPNKARTFLPTRGNGVTAQSGFDFQKDAGQSGVAREGLHADDWTEANHPRASDGKFGSGGHKESYKGHAIHVAESESGHKVAINGKEIEGHFPGHATAVQRAKHLIDRKRVDKGVEATMKEYAKGTLKSGSGEKVTDPKQALAIGYAEERGESETKRAATIIVRDGDKFLMGKRKADGKWSLPGGHVEKGESHHQGAVRELAEETNLAANRLKFLGGRMVEPKQGENVHVNMYEHHVDEDSKPSPKNDPDKEFSKLQWFSAKEPLPEDVLGNLAHPNNVALAHLGLLK